MAVFANWKAICKINDTKKAISDIEYQMGDMDLVREGNTAEFEKQKQDLVEATRTTNAEFEKTMIKRSKMMALMTETNQNSHF